jgi:hypothetical protein
VNTSQSEIRVKSPSAVFGILSDDEASVMLPGVLGGNPTVELSPGTSGPVKGPFLLGLLLSCVEGGGGGGLLLFTSTRKLVAVRGRRNCRRAAIRFFIDSGLLTSDTFDPSMNKHHICHPLLKNSILVGLCACSISTVIYLVT